MAPHVYIFGYQSILAAGSLASSIGAGADDFVPARLAGYLRTWDAVRDFTGNPRKRYVRCADWRVAGRVAFASLGEVAGVSVNGVCHRVPAARLDELDFREQGYVRVDVGGRLQPYPGYVLEPGLPCYAYLEPQPEPEPAPVSRAYYDMGRLGAVAIARRVPGFDADYLVSTAPPPELADDLAFVFIGPDGRHLWLLEEADSSLVLLLRFTRRQFAAEADTAPELDNPVTPALAWLDLRTRRPAPVPHPRIPAAMAEQLLAGDLAALAASPFWLCRLAATQVPALAADIQKILVADPDPWVRRAMQISEGDAA